MAPTASFTQTCTGLSCQFTNASTDSDGSIASRSWTFGDGAKSSTSNPAHSYASAGTYTVKLVVTDNDGASASFTRSVSVGTGNQPPTASFTQTCTGLSCQFTDESTDSDGSLPVHWWTFGDGDASGGLTPTHTYASAGTYEVKLVVQDNDGASASFTRSVTVGAGNVAPTASFTQTCTGLSCQFTNASTDSDGSIASRSWTFGDGAKSSTSNPAHSYASAGTYTVKLVVTDNDGASASFTRSVTVGTGNQPPTASFTQTCTGLSCQFTDESTDSDGSLPVHWWTFGDGDGSGGLTPTHTYASAGTYEVKLVVKDNDGASASFTRSVTVGAGNVAPTASFTQTCQGLSCQFTNASVDSDGSIASRSWTFGDGAKSSTSNPAHSYAAAGTYSVKVTVTDNDGASASFTRSVTVGTGNQPPTASFTQTCTGLSCQFTDESTDSDGSLPVHWWTFGDGDASGGLTPSTRTPRPAPTK